MNLDGFYPSTLALSLAYVVSLLWQGFLKLSAWLYLNLRNNSMDLNLTDNGHTEEQMPEVMTAGETHSHLPPLFVGNIAELRSAGQVEISEDATLEDLKTQVEYEGQKQCSY